VNDRYVRTVRSKGLHGWVVTSRHILRNALIPVITVIGLSLLVLFGGSVIIATIFQWPGIGLMFMNAITGRDSPVVIGYVLFAAIIVLASDLLADVFYSRRPCRLGAGQRIGAAGRARPIHRRRP
jgi:peptide/nickel transport system permease protein